MINFEELQEEYNSKNYGCETGRAGKVYLPSKMGKKPIHEEGRVFEKISDNDRYGMEGDTLYEDKEGNIYKFKYYKNETKFIDEYYPERIVNLRCNGWTCKTCRPIMMNKLHENIQREVNIWNINRHLIITFPGKPFRNKINFDKSYPIMNREYNKLLHRIYYEEKQIREGDKRKWKKYKNSFLKEGEELPEMPFSSIVLPRAQANPKENNPIGFCHLHNLMNWPINKHWIEEVILKNNYKIGYTFIRENQSVADYLCKDFYDDREWIIPFGIRHYRTTRNIKINLGYKKDNNVIYIPSGADINQVLKNNYTEIKAFGQTFKTPKSEILPLEEYIKKFYDITDKLGNKETVMTGKGIQHIYKTKNGMYIKNTTT